MKFFLPYPPSTNRYWRNFRGHTVVSKEAREYKELAKHLAMQQGVKPLDGELHVELRLFRPKRIGDLDNYIKVLFDAMNGVAWGDDSQVVSILASRYDDKGNPRVEIEVAQMEAA